MHSERALSILESDVPQSGRHGPGNAKLQQQRIARLLVRAMHQTPSGRPTVASLAFANMLRLAPALLILA